MQSSILTFEENQLESVNKPVILYVEIKEIINMLFVASVLDISMAVIELLNELSDVDTLNESVEGAKLLVEELSDFRVVSVLVQNMDRLDENNSKEVSQVTTHCMYYIHGIRAYFFYPQNSDLPF